MRAPLIIGGGPAGAAAAISLAASGNDVTLLERNAAPVDKLCGDFLSGQAIAALRALGIDARSMGGAPVRSIRLVHRRTVAEATLPFPAIGLSRRTLDDALLRLAAQRGATVLRGQSARGLERRSTDFIVRTATDGRFTADTVFLATGKHDLRGLGRPARADGLLGLKMYYELAPEQSAALCGRIELLLFDGGYAGLQQVEHGRAVLCLLVPAARYRRLDASWDGLLEDLAPEAPLLAQRLAAATPGLPQPLAIAGTPYGHLHRPVRDAPPRLFRLGDQACVVPSLAGDGMAIALHSGMAAASVWQRGGSAAEYHARLVQQASTPLRFAGLIHLACRAPAAQAVVTAACRTWPGLLRLAASFSRVARAD